MLNKKTKPFSIETESSVNLKLLTRFSTNYEKGSIIIIASLNYTETSLARI